MAPAGSGRHNQVGDEIGCNRSAIYVTISKIMMPPTPSLPSAARTDAFFGAVPLIDVHIHVGHRHEWTESARRLWMDTGPYVPAIYSPDGQQIPQAYGDAVKKEGVFGGILLPEYSPRTAGSMPFERACEVHSLHPELIPFANLNPEVHQNLTEAFQVQLDGGARGLKIHPIHGFFYANDPALYPVYEMCLQRRLPLMFHAGTSLFQGAKMRYSDPYTFDDVISDFPGLTIVLCHGGRGFWYHIAEFMAKRYENVYIDVSGLPPRNLLTYFPSMKNFARKYLFGTDFPGVPGIRGNYEAIANLVADTPAMDLIGFTNAYELFGFWKEGIFEVRDGAEIYSVINDGAKKYRGVIPADCYHEPYMPGETVHKEQERMRFYGYRKDRKLLGVMGREKIKDTTLIRHAYVFGDWQGKGIGSRMLRFIEKTVDTEYLLIGTWKAAAWAIVFYQKHGYSLMDHKDDLLRKYWDIPERQIETSCVLGKKMRQ
jgi:GNAT superfamily N-acetyltransferase